MLRLSQLHPNEGQINGVPNNPRKITQAEFEKLKKSIFESREFLVARPIVVDEGWNILGGNMRYRACCELRDAHAKNGAFEFSDEIPDEWVRQVQWTRKKKREFVAKDNKSSGEMDAALLAEWDDGELCDWGIIDDEEQKPDTNTDAWDDDEEPKPQAAVQIQTFETVKQKRQQLWGKDYKSEVVTDLKEEFLCHYLHGGGFFSIYRRNKSGYKLEDIKKEENRDFVETFAQSALKILRAIVNIGNASDMCIITTPRRRHGEGYHFATEVCKRLSDLSGIHFEPDVMTCKNHKRLDPVFYVQKEPLQGTYILYDDIITTGSTIIAARALYPKKNIITIASVCNRGATVE